MKKFYKENRVFTILMIVAFLCIATMATMSIVYVINSRNKDIYGNRLDGIKDVAIDKKMKKELEKDIMGLDKVKDAVINVHGKIINISIDFELEATFDTVKNTSIKALELIEDNYKNYYDIQFLITKSDLKDDEKESNTNYPMLGYMKGGASVITWSNNAE